MQIIGNDEKTYILLNGISIAESISLTENVELQPADTSHLDFATSIKTCTSPDDIAVVAAFIPLITSQLKITATTKKELAVTAWNSSWDVLLLSAIFQTEIGFNLQSDTSANEISENSNLRATNLSMYGISEKSSHALTANDIEWITSHFNDARQLLEEDRFQTAIHCLASYRWHKMPRVRMAILWAGIEGMFGASSEIRFRISLYIARFLYASAPNARKEVFESVKKLYNSRSKAVHGAKTKGDLNLAVEESAEILCNLIKQCVINKALPNEDELIP